MSNLACYGRDFDLSLGVCKAVVRKDVRDRAERGQAKYHTHGAIRRVEIRRCVPVPGLGSSRVEVR